MVIAIISLIPAFLIGWSCTHDHFKTVTPEYNKWDTYCNDKINNLINEFRNLSEFEKDNRIRIEEIEEKRRKGMRTFYFFGEGKIAKYGNLISQRIIKDPPYPKYMYASVWKCIIGAIISASLAFLAVLFSLRAVTRVLKWIANGFKK